MLKTSSPLSLWNWKSNDQCNHHVTSLGTTCDLSLHHWNVLPKLVNLITVSLLKFDYELASILEFGNLGRKYLPEKPSSI